MIDLATTAELQQHIVRDAGKMGLAASPAVAVVTAEATAQSQGLTLQDWVLILTIAYLAAQIGYLIWKWTGEYIRTRRAERRRARHPEDE